MLKQGQERSAVVEEDDSPLFPIRKVVFSKTGIGYFKSKSIQFVDLAKVKRITFLNELLKNDLRHLLGIMLQAKKKDLKSVTAFTKGSGERTVVASYIVEAPVARSIVSENN